MPTAKHRLKREPVAVASLVSVVVTLGTIVGLDLTVEQASAVVAVVTLAAGWWARSKVSPVE